jgi:fatty-acyl-CoA synthase
VAASQKRLPAVSGAKVVCAHSDYLDAGDSIRDQLPAVEHFAALKGAHDGGLGYENLLDGTTEEFASPEIAEGYLITINYISGTTAHPKGVMITHRNACLNALGTLANLTTTAADRYLWTLSMVHANGCTVVWIVTAMDGVPDNPPIT